MSFGANGAPVNLGCNNISATQLRHVVPHLIVVHGCPHRLELAIKSEAKSCSLMTVIDSVMEFICWLVSVSILTKLHSNVFCILFIRFFIDNMTIIRMHKTTG